MVGLQTLLAVFVEVNLSSYCKIRTSTSVLVLCCGSHSYAQVNGTLDYRIYVSCQYPGCLDLFTKLEHASERKNTADTGVM